MGGLLVVVEVVVGGWGDWGDWGDWGVGRSGGDVLACPRLLRHLAWFSQKGSVVVGLGEGERRAFPWCSCQWANAKARLRLSDHGLVFRFWFFAFVPSFGVVKIGKVFVAVPLRVCSGGTGLALR